MDQPVAQSLQDAEEAFAEGRLGAAENICRELLQADEKCAGAWSLMARLALLNGDLETAGDFAAVACEFDPTNDEFVRGLAEVYLQRKALEAAEGQARHAMELQPECSENQIGRAHV